MPASEKAHTVAATVVEGTTVRAHRILDPRETHFAAFLDGTQSSRVVFYLGAIPLVFGTVSAIIRRRSNRRMHTAAHESQSALYLPRRHVPPSLWDEGAGIALVDTCADEAGGPLASAHPTAFAERAFSLVRQRRDALETKLAERWCGRPDAGPLFVDGSISGSARLAAASAVVGVVKTHRALYVEGDAMATVLGLREGERSSVLRVTSRWAAAASWYLRLRDPGGQNPFWGMVRVEIAETQWTPDRVNEISRWILAEASPVSLPDARWDTMVYGIRDCEETLRAI
jgi:hypothetical protein